jgi:hypothetical protein
VRGLVDRQRLDEFMARLGAEARDEAVCLLTGGATAVAVGWRESTIDIDLELVPESDELLRAIARLKHELQINVELVSPGDFIPLPNGSGQRSIFVAREGKVTFRHVDLYAQALAKIERGHTRDLEDVREMGRRGLISQERLLECFEEIEAQLYRYPAVDPTAFRTAVEAAASEIGDQAVG